MDPLHISAKIAFCLLLILAFPVVAAATALVADRMMAKLFWNLVVPSLQHLHFLAKRYYVFQKIEGISLAVLMRFSSPWVRSGQIAISCITFWLFYLYMDTADAFDACLILVALSIMPLAALAILLCNDDRIKKAFDCPFCVWIRWTLLLTLIWAGHTQVTDRLSALFYGASLHLPQAFSAGAFLSAIGLLSILTAILLLGFQLLMLLGFGVTKNHRKQIGTGRLALATATLVLTFFQFAIYFGAQNALGTSKVSDLIIARLAYDFDMLNESTCTGKVSNRKIVYVGTDQSRAFVFSNPAATMKPAEQAKPIRLLNGKEIDARLPKYHGVVECRYPKA
ncbi:hypothetical protein WJH60_18840 [Burkholderia orbicola]|uniref:hypothetical protein n=1 Tax=Burkholderia orbicola TaxID=2978683 RepID=UPI0035C6BCF6